MSIDLSQSGLDETAQQAVEAMMLAHDQNRWADVVAIGDAWVDARGEVSMLASVWYAHGLLAVGRTGEALAWAKNAADKLPDREVNGKLAARMTYGQVLASSGHLAKARRVLKQVLADARLYTDGEAMEQLGYVTLAISEKWEQGWAYHEARLQREGRALPSNVTPWNGTDQVPVAVLHEQGIGDAVLAARWLSWVHEVTGHKPTWYGPSLMHRWVAPVAHIGNITALVESGEAVTGCYALSLPKLAGVNRPSMVHAPYAPPELHRARMSRYAPTTGTIRVGVCWKGSATNMLDFERSYEADVFAPMFAPIEGVEFVNLCHDAEVPEGAPFANRSFLDVYETGEIISDLDLVVSVDTAVVHIAGSLGVPTLALLPTKLDWRYQWPFGGSTPFYPSVTAIRRSTSTGLDALVKGRALLEKFAAQVRQRSAA